LRYRSPGRELAVYRDGEEAAWFTLPVFDGAGAVAAPAVFAGIFAVALVAPVLETATEKVKKQIGVSEIAAVAAEVSGGSLYDVEVRTVYGRTWTLVRDQDEAMAREGVKLIERARVQ
jgi:hypothetical protein